MITGFNTNVRHGGRVFHVQTEDSGRDRPHVISHVYCDGTILASEKSDYSDRLECGDLDAVLRGLMETQHRAMLEKLEQGGYDAVIDERLGKGSEASQGGTTAVDEREDGKAFGDGVVSARPLDAVILEYLVDKSRTRGGGTAPRPARGARPRK